MRKSKWFIDIAQNSDPRLRLYCFPYAGGSAATYAHWHRKLQNSVQVIAVQPPGRANRIFEPPFREMGSLIDALYAEIKPFLDRPYAFFGHSLGSRVAFELIKRIDRNKLMLPEIFFASGSRAPSVKPREFRTYDLPDKQFIEHLRSLNGTPEAIINNPDLMDLYLPLLRADFQISETYYSDATDKINSKICVFSGTKDEDITEQDLRQWYEHFHTKIGIKMIEGSHFFIEENSDHLLKEIKIRLHECIPDSSVREPLIKRQKFP